MIYKHGYKRDCKMTLMKLKCTNLKYGHLKMNYRVYTGGVQKVI